MKNKKKIAALLAGVLCVSVLGACSPANPSGSGNPSHSGTASRHDGLESSSVSQSASDETGGMLEIPFVGPSLGEFSTQGVDGNTYTQDIFKEYDLTMVNVFATWCSPCVREMPDLEKLHQQVADQGVNVIGVVLDVLDENGEPVQENLERAQELVKQTGVTYPVLLPDSGYFNGRLIGIEAIPETFFVDKNGDVVGETYSGSGGLEDWLEVVENELAGVKAGA